MALTEKDLATSGPVTVVILQSVKEGVGDAYAQWQRRTNEAAARFPGFLGADVAAPQGIQTDWVVVYRFATEEQLQAWLHSDELAAQQREGQQYYAAPPKQMAATSHEPTESGSVSVVVRHHVRPGQEEAYQRWQTQLAQAESQAPGYLGSELIPPGPGSEGVYSAILRFDTPEHLEGWMKSPARQKLLDSGKSIYQDFDATRVSGGFDGWFRFGQDSAIVEVPPLWKQTLSVILGLYPTVMLLTLLITSHIKWALAPNILLGNIMSSFVLSYLSMRGVNIILQWWLKPDPARRRQIDVLGVLFIGASLGIMAVLFWLITPIFIK